MVYLRENRSADQELKTAPKAEPAAQTPMRRQLLTILARIDVAKQTVEGPDYVCRSSISRFTSHGEIHGLVKRRLADG
jgi:hypothetical protein